MTPAPKRRTAILREWMLDALMISFGLLWILGGAALRDPNTQVHRWVAVAFGTTVVIAGIGCVIKGAPSRILQAPKGSQPFWLGVIFIQFGIAGFALLVFGTPFEDPEWVNQAPWIRWVWAAADVWAASAGLGLILGSRE